MREPSGAPMVGKDLKVAIVHDDFIQEGGAERLVLAMLEIWPHSDLYAVISSGPWRSRVKSFFGKEIRTTWLQKLPFRETLFRFYYLFYPLAIESFNFDRYDLVISSSARYAHGVITKPGTLHLSYVNSPARFLYQKDLTPKLPFARLITLWHKSWDRVAAWRPDYIVANSQTPAKRIKKFWKREVDSVIYPFVDWPDIDPSVPNPGREKGSYFLLISRLNGWKKVDLAVKVFSLINRPLYIIGIGPERKHLEKMAGSSVKFLGSVSDTGKFQYLTFCQALIVTQEEDFGIVTLEANICGRPVIAYGAGGSSELIKDGVNGILFDDQTVDGLNEALVRFDQTAFSRENCINAAKSFGKERFKAELYGFVSSKLADRPDTHLGPVL